MDASDTDTALTITHDAATRRYEGRLPDRTVASIADYRDDSESGTRSFVHTETKPQFGGRGYAAQVVGFAIDDTEAAGLTPVPACSYVAQFLARRRSDS